MGDVERGGLGATDPSEVEEVALVLGHLDVELLPLGRVVGGARVDERRRLARPRPLAIQPLLFWAQAQLSLAARRTLGVVGAPSGGGGREMGGEPRQAEPRHPAARHCLPAGCPTPPVALISRVCLRLGLR